MNGTDVIDDDIVEVQPTLRETLEDSIQEHAPELLDTKSELAPVAEVQPPSTEPATVPSPADAKTSEVTQPAVTPPASTELKAPAQWKPTVREEWNKLPRSVQEEVLRRESDNMRLIGSVGPKIRMADSVAQHIAPFKEMLATNGVAEQDFIADVFSSVKDLRDGTPEQKAEVVANIVQSYGIDVHQLDRILTGRLQQPPEVLEARRSMARANSIINQQRSNVDQQTAAEADKTIAAFAADPKHEFIDTVRNQMADLIELGHAKSLDDAYKAAIWANPETRQILLEREAQGRAKVKNDRANAARRASSSVRGAPSSGRAAATAIPEGGSLRATLEAAFDDASSL